MFIFFRSKQFWIAAIFALITLGIFFAWELGVFAGNIWSPPRPDPKQEEIWFTALIIFLIALNMGLMVWRKSQGSCPVGNKRANAIAGALGAFTLLCPACLLLPLTLFGTGVSLIIFAPYLPLIRLIVLILLGVSTWMLWPKRS